MNVMDTHLLLRVWPTADAHLVEQPAPPRLPAVLAAVERGLRQALLPVCSPAGLRLALSCLHACRQKSLVRRSRRRTTNVTPA